MLPAGSRQNDPSHDRGWLYCGEVSTDHSSSDEVLTVDLLARGLLAALVAEPGVHRAGLALIEGGGRRLTFTASDRDGTQVEWCHIDAYDDVPLTMVVRTGERIIDTLAELRLFFPAYAERLSAGPTVSVVAIPVLSHGRPLGGIIVFCDDGNASGPALLHRVSTLADEAGDTLRRAQLRAPRVGLRLADEPVDDGVLAFDCEVEGDPRAVGTARRFLRRALADRGLDDDVVDTAVLCLSEIVTNAVIHTGVPSELRLVLDAEVLTVTVRDGGSHHRERPGAPADDDPLRVHGRGLQLVDALSARWGSELDATGTTVWFVLEAH